MNLTSENYRDIEKYYKGCYVKYPEYFGDKLFHVQRVTDSNITGYHQNDETGEEEPYEYALYPENYEGARSINAEFILPRKSYFMVKGFAHLLFRLPARQYKKGISDENTAIVRLDGQGGFTSVGIDWDILKAYVNKPSFAKFDLTRTQMSYALSPRIACCLGGNLFVDRVKIGIFHAKEQKIVLKNAMFLDEVQTLVKSCGQEISITTGKV